MYQVPAWVPSRGPGAPRRAAQCEVKPLFGICVELLVEYIDDVETLWGLPDAIKVRFRPLSQLLEDLGWH